MFCKNKASILGKVSDILLNSLMSRFKHGLVWFELSASLDVFYFFRSSLLRTPQMYFCDISLGIIIFFFLFFFFAVNQHNDLNVETQLTLMDQWQ